MSPEGDFEYLALSWYSIYSYTNEMKKLKSGFLLKDILDRFSRKVNSTLSPDRSLWLYYAHDITMTNMLSTLGFFKKVSKYNFSFFLDLHQSNHKIQFQFSGSSAGVRVLPFYGSLWASSEWDALRSVLLPKGRQEEYSAEHWKVRCKVFTEQIIWIISTCFAYKELWRWMQVAR